jgi:hypothetical protein
MVINDKTKNFKTVLIEKRCLAWHNHIMTLTRLKHAQPLMEN